jgi:hypothetical protein
MSELFRNRMKQSARIRHLALALVLFASGAKANLLTNGNFSSTTNGGGQLGYNTTATGWSTTGYNFLFTSGSADTTGVTGSNGTLKLWGPGDGSANGLPASSPDGGNYVGADGAYQVGAITQTVSGLTALNSYVVSFYWAAAQQSGFGCVSPANPGGCTTDQWQVSLGNQTFSTPVASTGVNQGGFSGWMSQSFVFTATNSTAVLSFLAVGTPSGEPPFALLDGVTLSATPEPGTLMLLAGAVLLGVGQLVRKGKSKNRG